MASNNNNNNHEKHNHQTPPPPQGTPPPPSQPDHSGLQVVETGLEVAGSDQSEALSAGSYPSSHPFIHHNDNSSQLEASPPLRYAEQKGYDWNGAPPPQVVPIEQAGVMMGPGHRLYSASTGTSQQRYQHQYLGGHNPFDPAAGKLGKRPICGLKRKLFWGIVGVAVIVMVLAVAVGLGVGLAVRNSSVSTGSATSSSTASASTTLPTATATATAVANSTIQCPSANLTLYELATSTDTQFLVLCGRDYNSDDGAIDINQVNTTFEGCLDQCGDTDGCVAVGWGNYYGTDTCWLKSQIGTPNWSSNWYSAVLDG